MRRQLCGGRCFDGGWILMLGGCSHNGLGVPSHSNYLDFIFCFCCFATFKSKSVSLLLLVVWLFGRHVTMKVGDLLT